MEGYVLVTHRVHNCLQPSHVRHTHDAKVQSTYSKKQKRLYQPSKNEPAVGNFGNIILLPTQNSHCVSLVISKEKPHKFWPLLPSTLDILPTTSKHFDWAAICLLFCKKIYITITFNSKEDCHCQHVKEVKFVCNSMTTFMLSTASSSLVVAVSLQLLAQCQKCRIMSSAQSFIFSMSFNFPTYEY